MTRGCTRDSIVGHYQQFQHKLWRVGAATWRGIYTPCLGESSASPGPTMPSTLSSMAIIHGHRRHGHRGHGHRPWPSKARVSSTAINHGYHPQLINAHHPLPFPAKCLSRPHQSRERTGTRLALPNVHTGKHYRCDLQRKYRHIDHKRLACRSCFCVLMVLSSHTSRDNAAMGRFL